MYTYGLHRLYHTAALRRGWSSLGRGCSLPPPRCPLRSWYPQPPFSGGKGIQTRDPPAVPVWLGKTATALTHCLHAWSRHSFGREGWESCSQGAGRYAVPNLWLRRCGQALTGCYAACKISHVSEVWKTLQGFVRGKIQDGDGRVGDRDFTWGTSFCVTGSERPDIRPSVRNGCFKLSLKIPRVVMCYGQITGSLLKMEVVCSEMYTDSNRRKNNYFYKWAQKQLIVAAP